MRRSPWQIQKSVAFALFIRELKSRFGTYKGGYLWMLAEPLAHVVILSTIFSTAKLLTLFAIDIPVFLTTGIVPFLLLKNVTLRVMDGVESNRGLFGFRQIKPMDTFIVRAILETLLSVIVFVLLLVGMAWIGMDVPMHNPLVVAFVLLLLSCGGLGLGMIYSIIRHYLPEITIFLRMTFLPLFLLSGIIYPIASLPHEVRDFLTWNPVLHAIEVLREAFFTNYHLVQGVSLIYFSLTALSLLLVGLSLYRNQRYELISQ